MVQANRLATLCERCREKLRLPESPSALNKFNPHYFGSPLPDSWDDFIPFMTSATARKTPTDLFKVPCFTLEETYPILPILQESAWECQFCELVLSTVRSREVGQFLNDRAAGMHVFEVKIDVAYRWKYPDIDAPLWFLMIGVEFSQPKLCTSLIHFAPPISENVLPFIESALVDCNDSHQHATSVHLPRRLIDVRKQLLKVVDTQVNVPLSGDERFVALSYCWGDAAEAATQYKLVKSSEEFMARGFDVNILSPVHQDAIAVGRALSIPYVWIDAICILQDDVADWEQEAAQMAKIYAASYITICATKSWSNKESFLCRNTDPLVLPFRAKRKTHTVDRDAVSEGDTVEGSYCVQRNPIWSLSHRLSFFDADLQFSRWNSRAWTFQERLMPKRLVYIGNSGAHFVCSEGMKSEHYWAGTQSIGMDFKIENLHNETSEIELDRLWLNVAHEYSERHVTFPSDILPGLSGIAQRFSALSEDSYIAGLWKTKLLEAQLTWSIWLPTFPSLDALVDFYANQSPYAAPSWSWVGRGSANLKSRSRLNYISECELIDASAAPRGNDKFGALGSASLCIRGHLVSFNAGALKTLGGSASRYVYDTDGEDGLKLHIFMDCKGAGHLNVLHQLKGLLLGSANDCPEGILLFPVNAAYIRVGTFAGNNESKTSRNQRFDLTYFRRCERQVVTVI